MRQEVQTANSGNPVLGAWLTERQHLISLYCSLAVPDQPTARFENRIRTFCQVLIDYISAGHFEVFTELDRKSRATGGLGAQVLEAIYHTSRNQLTRSLNSTTAAQHCNPLHRTPPVSVTQFESHCPCSEKF
jgi:regulator of sigma D